MGLATPRLMRAWWCRQTGLQQWGWVTAGTVLALMLLVTAGWAVTRI